MTRKTIKIFLLVAIIILGVVLSVFVTKKMLGNLLNPPDWMGYIKTPEPSPEQIKTEIIKLINNERVKMGLQILKESPLLNKSAQLKANDMVKNKYYTHISPNGTTPWYFFHMAGYNYKYAAENLSEGYYSTQATVNAWMNSPEHRENILSPRYTETGVGMTEEYFNRIFVEHFANPL